MGVKDLFQYEVNRREALAAGHIVPDPARCVQCGICSFNCPLGLDIRRFSWRGQHIEKGYCLTCGECVIRCPRGALRLERTELFLSEK